MKHISIILTLFCIFTLSAGELKLFPSLMVNLTDQANFVPRNRPLQINTVSKVERGQPFYVNAALILKQPLEKDLQLTGTMRISTKKTETSLKWSEPIRLPAGSRGVIILPRYITVIFDQKDKPGKRDFTLTLTDGDKKILTASAAVELVESITDFRMMDKKEFDQFFARYYSNPRPERLLAALNYFLTEEVVARRRNRKRRYDPRSVLHGFAEAFKLNPQFFDELANMSGTEAHKNFDFAFLLADIGPQMYTKHKAAINPHVIAQMEKFNYRNPMEVKQPELPVHLEILMSEFLITGRFAAVKRLTATLTKKRELSIHEVKKLTDGNKKLSPEQQKLFRNWLMRTISVIALRSCLKDQHHLLRFYLEYILNNKVETDKQSATIIAALLNEAKSTQGNKK
ncbi:MAG: hypothetical protein IKC89_01850 [Lentisphaeria bacterium]|nr:hypothetical protein [Lentisphaeria bacterium]